MMRRKRRSFYRVAAVLAAVAGIAWFFTASNEPEPLQPAKRPGRVRPWASPGAAWTRAEWFALALDRAQPLGLADGAENFTEYFGLATPGRFQGEVACRFTVPLFKNLQRRFADAANLEAHYRAVRDYLLQEMMPAQADQMFAIYRKLTEYEMNRERNEADIRSELVLGSDFDALDADEQRLEYSVDYLHARQERRRRIFGRELADALFGEEVKRDEYGLRKQYVMKMVELYGEEKEQILGEVKDRIYGEESELVEPTFAFRDYREKLALYDRDLREAPEPERERMMAAFRERCAPPDALAGIEALQRKRRSRSNRRW